MGNVPGLAANSNAIRFPLVIVDQSRVTIGRLTTYDDQVSSYFTQERLVVRLTAIFGALALLLASVGLYGVTAYGVARRTPEIGLRMALGADRASVVRLVLNGAAEQTGMGLLLGVLLALIAGHYLQSQLYEVKGYNVSTLLAACTALTLSTLIASALPARRASNVDPMQALRTNCSLQDSAIRQELAAGSQLSVICSCHSPASGNRAS
jgi:ABC-type antimicrobial peptide transport system permease subunit